MSLFLYATQAEEAYEAGSGGRATSCEANLLLVESRALQPTFGYARGRLFDGHPEASGSASRASFTQTTTGPYSMLRTLFGHSWLAKVTGVSHNIFNQSNRFAYFLTSLSQFTVAVAAGERNGWLLLSMPHRMISTFLASATIASFRLALEP